MRETLSHYTVQTSQILYNSNKSKSLQFKNDVWILRNWISSIARLWIRFVNNWGNNVGWVNILKMNGKWCMNYKTSEIFWKTVDSKLGKTVQNNSPKSRIQTLFKKILKIFSVTLVCLLAFPFYHIRSKSLLEEVGGFVTWEKLSKQSQVL